MSTDGECERIARYRRLEAEALRAAAACKHVQTRDAYKTIAVAWAKLISDIEEMARHEDEFEPNFFPPPVRPHTGKTVRR